MEFFWPYVAIITAAAIKKDCSYRKNCGIRLHAGDLEHSLMKGKKIGLHIIFFSLFMFCYSRFRFRHLNDANSCMFSWCITTRSLLICSWHDITLSQFVQSMYSIYRKYLLFASISYVQESFKLNEVNHG